MITYILLVVEVVVAILLVGTILLQRSKDQGLGLAFGSGMGESLFGAQAVNVLVKITITLAIVFFLNTIILARIFASPQSGRSVMAGETSPGPMQPTPAAQPQPVSPIPAEGTPGDVIPVEVPTAVPQPQDGTTEPIEIPAGTPVEPDK